MVIGVLCGCDVVGRSFDTGDDDASASVRSTITGEPPSLLKALQTVAAHCQAQMCQVAQRPIMGSLEGRIAGEEATRVTTAATLAPQAASSGTLVRHGKHKHTRRDARAFPHIHSHAEDGCADRP